MTDRSRSETISTKQERIAELAKKMPGRAMSTLSHHIDQEWMKEAYRRTRKNAAAGVDGQTAAEFEQNLEDNLQALIDQAKSGTYRAPPVRRVHIPKADGRTTRPIGIPTFGDKVLQRAAAMLLEPIYEQDFFDFSYGFRPGRSAHDAIKAIWKHCWDMEGGWVLEVDIRSFFDSLDRQALRDILRQRVTDGVVVRLVGKWLNAGVLDGGVMTRPQSGTPQGGVISPLLANIYLHEVLDSWWVRDVQPRMRGRAQLIRYADDFLILFEEQDDARRVQAVLPKRFGKYGLTLHPDKTRLVPFKRPPPSWRKRDGGADKPGSFDFLGFTHYWAKSRRGRWVPKQKTAKDRLASSLRRMNRWCRKIRHWSIAAQAQALNAKLRGHYLYFGISGNSDALQLYFAQVKGIWKKWLGRRSQRRYLTSESYSRLLCRHPLLPPILYHSEYRKLAKP